MDLTTQLYFLWILVLANSHVLPGFGPPGHRDPGPPDILDPLHLNPHRGPFDHHPPGPGFYDRHHRDHGMLEDFLDPIFGDSDDRIEGRNNNRDNIRVTDNTPLKVNLLSEANKNKTYEKDIGKNAIVNNNNQLAKNVVPLSVPPKDDQIIKPREDKNIVTPTLLPKDDQSLRTHENKNVVLPTLGTKDDRFSRPHEDKNATPPTVAVKEEHTVKPNEDKIVEPPTIPAKEEQILRTNEDKTVTPRPISDQISKSNINAIMPVKLNASQEKSHSGDSIIFPDSVDEVKSRFKDVNTNTNKTSNLDAKNDDINGSVKMNITKNRDGVFIPVQAVPVNPIQDNNGKFLLIPINPSGNTQNQALPITNDVFPNRSPVYTTVRPIPFYTNVANALPLNVQPSNTWRNGNNNYYQNPGPAVPRNPSYNTDVNNPNGNNWNSNVGTFNPNPSNSIGNGQVSPNPVGIQTTMYNPTLQQQQSINGYNIAPNYNNQQANQYPARNLQDNGINQQTVSSGAVPTYNNIQGSEQQGVINHNTVPNYNGNSGQTYIPANLGPNNNIQSYPNGQQFYAIPNGNQLNNNNIDQSKTLNAQGNVLNPNNGNNQQYMLINGNQINLPQNGQGNNNIYTLPNGQLVALIPVQLSNGGLVNNAINKMTPVNGNVVQPNTLFPNLVNSQPNLVPMNNNPSQPNVILMNGNIPNGAVLVNGQATNLNGQNPIPNSIMLNAQNVLGNGQPPSVNNGQSLYTMVIVPNNYATNVGGNSYQVTPSSINLVNTRDKEGKDD